METTLMEKNLSKEELQRLVNVLTNIIQRTAADLANLNDRVGTLNQVVTELRTFLGDESDAENGESVTAEDTTTNTE